MKLPHDSRLRPRLGPLPLLALACVLVLGLARLFAPGGQDVPAAGGVSPPMPMPMADVATAQPVYICPMHPTVTRHEPGRCPICGMDLVLKTAGAAPPTELSAALSYVCPMHPEVIRSTPGRCPICGMDLVAEGGEDASGHDHAAGHAHLTGGQDAAMPIQVSAAVIGQLGVRTARAELGDLHREVQGIGIFLRTTLQGYHGADQAPVQEAPSAPPAPTAVTVQGQVFERDAPLLRVGQRVRVQVPNLSTQVWEGQVSSFEAQVNQGTRTQVFNVAVDPKSGKVPPGMTVLITVELDPIEGVLLVPREAVIITGRGSRVVVALGEGRFEPREVQTDDLGEDRIIVRSGLAEGEEVVVSAQFLLDSEANLQAGLQRLNSGHAAPGQAASGMPAP